MPFSVTQICLLNYFEIFSKKTYSFHSLRFSNVDIFPMGSHSFPNLRLSYVDIFPIKPCLTLLMFFQSWHSWWCLWGIYHSTFMQWRPWKRLCFSNAANFCDICTVNNLRCFSHGAFSRFFSVPGRKQPVKKMRLVLIKPKKVYEKHRREIWTKSFF